MCHATQRRIPEDNNILFFLFSTRPIPALFPTQLSVHCVQLFFDGDQNSQDLNLTNRLSPLSSPKFILTCLRKLFDISIYPSFRWKLKEKESLHDEVKLILRFVGGKELQVLPVCWLVKVPRNTLIATLGFCKCGHENTGFDKLQKCQLFKKIRAPWSVCLLWRHVCLEGKSGGFLFFTSGTSHLVRLYKIASKVGLLTETALHDLTLIKNSCCLPCGYRKFLN
jgi:hypothetical protein